MTPHADTALDARTWSARNAHQVVGISYRQLDYWARTDLVRPSARDAAGSGTSRAYTRDDLLLLLLIATLSDGGTRLERIREIVDLLPSDWTEPGQFLMVGRPAIDHPGVLVVPASEAAEFLAAMGGPVTTVGITQLNAELDAAIGSWDRELAARAARAADGYGPHAGWVSRL